jgi:hypothetical protein
MKLQESQMTAPARIRLTSLKPKVANPSALEALRGPTHRLMAKATNLFGHECVPFYSGANAVPK